MNENKKETEVMRENIVWLSNELVSTRRQVKRRNEILSELLDPDSYGWSVPQEIRSRIYTLFNQEREAELDSYNRK